ncbi:MAG: aminomethyltransferase [Lysobacterales bacterium]|jgi:aminomethyltransferase|nr:MAG: aminomethyltransferase [Xanthomonadales bacterium]
MRQTPLHAIHLESGARMVPFAGWSMPLHYGSQIAEHHAVRREAGVFDVSHMGVVDLRGEDAESFLRRLLANDVARLREPGRALYTTMLAEDGGILDDLIVYRLAPGRFRIVVNAATREKDLDWMRRQATGHDVTIALREDLAMIAVQGPKARERVASVLCERFDPERLLALPRFAAIETDGWMIARTGYTGEDGFELILPAAESAALWRSLIAQGVTPAGLGARDTLRLEAGMLLYGQDMDETVSPLECGLAWTVVFDPPDRDFIGRRALERQREEGLRRELAGVVLPSGGILRSGTPIETPLGPGLVTSGGFGPTVGCSIGLARVPAGAGDALIARLRDRELPLRRVKPPFAREGRSLLPP